MLRLVEQADLVIENYTPRVLESFDLGWDVIHAANPRAVMVRMPAFGLTGPWRDRPGFAQTMEQITGLAWLTGFADDQPRIQRGPCDPNGGLHAAFAALVGLARRDRTGRGAWSRRRCSRPRSASPPSRCWSGPHTATASPATATAAPRPHRRACTPARGTEQWLALAVATDEQWRGPADGDRPPATSPTTPRSPTGRAGGADHDRLDAAIAAWAAPLDLAEAVEALVAAGVPAAPATDPRRRRTIRT